MAQLGVHCGKRVSHEDNDGAVKGHKYLHATMTRKSSKEADSLGQIKRSYLQWICQQSIQCISFVLQCYSPWKQIQSGPLPLDILKNPFKQKYMVHTILMAANSSQTVNMPYVVPDAKTHGHFYLMKLIGTMVDSWHFDMKLYTLWPLL